MAEDTVKTPIRSLSQDGSMDVWYPEYNSWTVDHIVGPLVGQETYGWFTGKDVDHVLQVLTESWNYRIIESDEEWEWLKIN